MMKINKIKELKTGYKLLICIFITIIGLICSRLLLNDWENKEKNFDYSTVYSVNGIITKVDWDHYVHGYDDHTVQTSAYMKVKLENGKTIEIGLGGSTSGYTEGENIIIYTDGTHYSITQEGVAADEQLTFFNLLGSSVIAVFMLASWTLLFGWKGFLIAFLSFIVILEF